MFLMLEEEEKFRNSVMCDLLYVHPCHPLAAQITLYYLLCQMEKLPWTIDTDVSGGMNGFIWLTNRNGLKQFVPSPIYGLVDITNNHILNITYLNPTSCTHVSKPPEGAIMPKKILKPIDIKPFPTLWHEDNSRRHHLGKERSQISGAISGPVLGEAAYRLVHNTLNIKLGHTNYHNNQGNHFAHWPRPTGPPAYQRGISEVPSSQYNSSNHRPRPAGQYRLESGPGRYGYQGQRYHEDPNFMNGHYGPRGPIGSMRQGAPPNDTRQSFNSQDRHAHQEQQYDLRNGMSGLNIGSYSTIPLAAIPPRLSSPGPMHIRPRPAQAAGPLPSPPSKWISRPAAGNTVVMQSMQQQTSATTAGNERQKLVKLVYQVKTKTSQNLEDSRM